jgi:hypothetical protein
VELERPDVGDLRSDDEVGVLGGERRAVGRRERDDASHQLGQRGQQHIEVLLIVDEHAAAPPGRRLAVEALLLDVPEHHARGPADVDRDHRAIAGSGHHVDGEVVEQPAVDQQAALRGDRWRDAGDVHARADGEPQGAAPVDVELTAEDVDADAENGRGVISIGPRTCATASRARACRGSPSCAGRRSRRAAAGAPTPRNVERVGASCGTM